MFPKILALLEAIHVGLSAARAAYNDAMEDSEPSQTTEVAINTETLVKEMNDRVLSQILHSRAHLVQEKRLLN